MIKKVKNPLFLLFLIVIATIITFFNLTHLVRLYEYYTLWQFVGLASVMFIVLVTVYVSFLVSYLNVDPNILKEDEKEQDSVEEEKNTTSE